MKLIGNNCLIGFTYRDILKQEYQTPFIWSRLWNDDLINLLQNYENINFNNYELKKTNPKLKDNDNDFYILLDNKVKIYFRHCFFSIKHNEPKKFHANVYFNKIWEYVFTKYIERTERMLKCTEKPIVIIHDCSPYYNLKDIIKICKEKHFRCMIFTNNMPETNDSDLCIKPVKEDIPGKIIETYKKEILEFIKSKNLVLAFNYTILYLQLKMSFHQ